MQRAETTAQPLDTPPALKLLLEGVIDYAGLFPPASLSLEASIENFARYRQTPDAWMLGRFVCPAGRLDDLLPFDALFSPEAPCPIALLSSGGATGTAFLEAFAHGLGRAAILEQRSEHAFRIDVVECKWPPDLLRRNEEDVAAFLSHVTRQATRHSVEIEFIYLELPLHLPPETLTPTLKAAAAHNRNAGQRPSFGAKMRCGGTEAAAFPSAEHVASFILACTEAEVPFKATAGLHHPLPRHDHALGVRMHGFLNVLFATIFARTNGIDAADLVAVLDDDNAAGLRIGRKNLEWGSRLASLDAVRQARTQGLVSFGSCSFDEPIEDLRNLGLLP